MDKKMETTIVYWGSYWGERKINGDYYSILGTLENKMETTIVYWGLYWALGHEPKARAHRSKFAQLARPEPFTGCINLGYCSPQ